MGWRYQYILIGGLTLTLAIIRVFFMKMEESPKWLVTQGQFEKAIASMQEISRVNKRPLTITAADFRSLSSDAEHKVADKALTHAVHVRGLFATRKLVRSTSGLIVLWMCIGIA